MGPTVRAKSHRACLLVLLATALFINGNQIIPPSSYHHRSELRPTIFFIFPDSTVGTIISISDPLISKIKKQTFQFKQSPKSLTHHFVFLSLLVSDFSSMASTNVNFQGFVGGLAWAIDDQALERAFSPYKNILESKIRWSSISSEK